MPDAQGEWEVRWKQRSELYEKLVRIPQVLVDKVSLMAINLINHCGPLRGSPRPSRVET